MDSESLPIVVSPKEKLLGKVVWVGGTGFSSAYALIGDVDTAFGEGSIVLHQLLLTGSVTKQRSGPISLQSRCGAEELGLIPPFQSRTDQKKDYCRPGYTPKKPSDIRAYAGISSLLEYVILGKANFPEIEGVCRWLACLNRFAWRWVESAKASLAFQGGRGVHICWIQVSQAYRQTEFFKYSFQCRKSRIASIYLQLR